jgi:hypothetical protein
MSTDALGTTPEVMGETTKPNRGRVKLPENAPNRAGPRWLTASSTSPGLKPKPSVR